MTAPDRAADGGREHQAGWWVAAGGLRPPSYTVGLAGVSSSARTAATAAAVSRNSRR